MRNSASSNPTSTVTPLEYAVVTARLSTELAAATEVAKHLQVRLAAAEGRAARSAEERAAVGAQIAQEHERLRSLAGEDRLATQRRLVKLGKAYARLDEQAEAARALRDEAAAEAIGPVSRKLALARRLGTLMVAHYEIDEDELLLHESAPIAATVAAVTLFLVP